MSVDRLLKLAAVMALLAGCVQQDSPQVAGDKIDLPRNCMMVKFANENHVPLPEFVRFDGEYPDGWPQQIVLPAGSYLLNGGRILIKDSTENSPELGHYIGYQATGLVEMSYHDVRAHFENGIRALGVNPVGHESDSYLWGVPQYTIHLTPDFGDWTGKSAIIHVSIPGFADLGDWSYYLFQFSIRQ